MKKPPFYLCSFDISDNKKRTKMVKFLKKIGYRLQKSVFIIYPEEKIKEKIFDFFKKIKDKNDKLGLFFICENCQKKINHLPKIKEQDYEII
jgi:CRISPR-associated protein Cas2